MSVFEILLLNLLFIGIIIHYYFQSKISKNKIENEALLKQNMMFLDEIKKFQEKCEKLELYLMRQEKKLKELSSNSNQLPSP